MKVTYVATTLALLFVAGIATYTAIVACARADVGHARDTARCFIGAMARDDADAARSVMTRQARDNFTGSRVARTTHDSSDYAVGEPQVDKDKNQATVPVTLTDDKGQKSDARLLLRREDNAWRVYAMKVPIAPDGPIVTMDFEHPEAIFGDVFRVAGEGLGAAMKGAGEGMGAFMKGLGEGVAAMNRNAPSPTR